MSNQVYRNPYNGGNSYAPQITKNIYKLQADALAPNTNYGVKWDGIRWNVLNGVNVNPDPITPAKLAYSPAKSTLNEIRPVSDTGVELGVTYFYVLQAGDYHIEYTLIWTDVAGTNFIGIQLETFNPITNLWEVDPIVRGATSGLQNAIGNPLITGLSLDIFLASNQRFKAVYQVSNSVTIIANHLNLTSSNLIISRN